MLGLGPLRCPREERVAHPVLAVDVLGAHPLRDQRLGAARVDGDLAAAAGHLDRVERVLDLLLERDVPAADGDRLEPAPAGRAGAISSEKTSSPAVSVSMIRRVMRATASRFSSSARVGEAGDRRPRARPCARRRRSPSGPPRRRTRPPPARPRRRRRTRRPRPVVSTGRAGNAGTMSPPSRAPSSPSVTTSVAVDALDGRSLASRSATRSRHAARSARGGAGAGFRIVRTPAARRDLERVQRRLQRDLELDEQDVGLRDPRREARPRARGVSAESAPGTITIRLSPRRLDEDRRGHRRQRRPERPRRASTPSSAHSSNARVAERVRADRGQERRPPPRAAPRRPPGSSPCRRGRGGTASRSASRRARARASTPKVSPTP